MSPLDQDMLCLFIGAGFSSAVFFSIERGYGWVNLILFPILTLFGGLLSFLAATVLVIIAHFTGVFT